MYSVCSKDGMVENVKGESKKTVASLREASSMNTGQTMKSFWLLIILAALWVLIILKTLQAQRKTVRVVNEEENWLGTFHPNERENSFKPLLGRVSKYLNEGPYKMSLEPALNFEFILIDSADTHTETIIDEDKLSSTAYFHRVFASSLKQNIIIKAVPEWSISVIVFVDADGNFLCDVLIEKYKKFAHAFAVASATINGYIHSDEGDQKKYKRAVSYILDDKPITFEQQHSSEFYSSATEWLDALTIKIIGPGLHFFHQ